MNVRVFAPAKINLTLEVGRPRADGRHPLQSAVVFADVGDWIEAEAGPRGLMEYVVTGPFEEALIESRGAPPGVDSVMAATLALMDAYELWQGGTVRLEKNLPIASGIGGGSSDAAATLKALRAIWDVAATDDDLTVLAQKLGADVPVCVGAQTAWMTGAGEMFEPLTTPPLDAVLVNPLKPLSTAEVYRQFDRMELGGSFTVRPAPAWREVGEAIAAIKAIGNDLEAPARALMPDIDEMMAALAQDKRALHVAMSGSGATVFALCENAAAASALAAAIARAHADWWVRAARLG